MRSFREKHPRAHRPPIDSRLTFLAILHRRPRAIAFGLLQTFTSSVGQTFLISLFLPEIKRVFGLGDAEISSLFALATISSAAVLWQIGPVIDRMDVVRYSLASGLFLSCACLVMASAPIVPVLLIGFFCLRLGGQGLLTHVAVTATARYFHAGRGKALSLVLLGHALGEAILPGTVVVAITQWGWRMTFVGASVVVMMLVLIACALVRRQLSFRVAPSPAITSLPAGPALADATLAAHFVVTKPGVHFLRTRYFQLALPLFLATPMIATALVFHQALIAHAVGMSLQWFAVSFTGYAVAKVVSSLLVGPAIDRFGAARLFSLHLVPMTLGIVVLVTGSGAAATPIYWVLLGVSSGMSGPLQAAIVATHVAPHALGAARSVLASLAIVASALGPAIYGVILATSIPLSGLLWGNVLVLIAVTWLGVLAERHVSRSRQ